VLRQCLAATELFNARWVESETPISLNRPWYLGIGRAPYTTPPPPSFGGHRGECGGVTAFKRVRGSGVVEVQHVEVLAEFGWLQGFRRFTFRQPPADRCHVLPLSVYFQYPDTKEHEIPKLTIYLPNTLACEVERYDNDINVSQVCQEALAKKVGELSGSGRQILVNFLIEQARWRERVAEDYPEDHRNKQSTLALAGLAEFVRRMPVGHPSFVAINTLQNYGGSGFLSGDEFSSMAGRFGFANNWVGPDEEGMEQFVVDLVDVYVREWLDSYADADADDWEAIAAEVGMDRLWIQQRKQELEEQ